MGHKLHHIQDYKKMHMPLAVPGPLNIPVEVARKKQQFTTHMWLAFGHEAWHHYAEILRK